MYIYIIYTSHVYLLFILMNVYVINLLMISKKTCSALAVLFIYVLMSQLVCHDMTLCQTIICSKNQVLVARYVVWGVWGCLVMGAVSRFWLMGLGIGHFWCTVSKKCQNRGHQNNYVLVSWTQKNKKQKTSTWYQCWLNCQKIFFGGNPWSMNNVQHFTKIWFWSKFMSQLHEFTYFMFQDGGAPILFPFFFFFY